ncbi:MAG: hypothetical protein EOM05_05095 [Clostridia bacterium]|nr:hypothetical protein [Clostridia bacterium]
MMKDKLNVEELKGSLLQRLKTDKKLLFILIVGLLGMLLLLLTEFTDSDKSEKQQSEIANADTQYTYEQNYKKQVQDDLQEIISSIDGAGKTNVMITLDSGSKSIYAVDETISDTSDSLEKEKEYSKDSKYARDTEHIIINSSDKDEAGLIVEVIQPQIRGVAIVCEGASSAVVRQNITDTVTAVLNISSIRVCITKMTKD